MENDVKEKERLRNEKRLEQYTGSPEEAKRLFKTMTSSRDQAIAYLDHTSLTVREVALSILSMYWPPDSSVENIYVQLASKGPESLQVGAIMSLALARKRLYSKQVAITLAEFALNSNIPLRVRYKVYSLLKKSFGPIEARLEEIKRSQEEGMDTEIDPKIVQQCIDWEKKHYHASRQPEDYEKKLEEIKGKLKGKQLEKFEKGIGKIKRKIKGEN